MHPPDPSASTQDQELTAIGMHFSYGSREIFRSFDFSARERIVLLRGPSGCGKTTLLKLFAGVFRPARAERLTQPEGAVMIVQEDALAPWLTGYQNITRFTSLDRSQIEHHDGFPLTRDLLSRPVYELSFGQRRIIELFRAILLSPPLLCLDEPFSFLDPATRDGFTSLLFDPRLLEHTQLLISSHYHEDFSGLDLAEYVFDRPPPVTALTTVLRLHP